MEDSARPAEPTENTEKTHGNFASFTIGYRFQFTSFAVHATSISPPRGWSRSAIRRSLLHAHSRLWEPARNFPKLSSSPSPFNPLPSTLSLLCLLPYSHQVCPSDRIITMVSTQNNRHALSSALPNPPRPAFSAGVTVFCGSSSGHDPIYEDTAAALARAIAGAGMTLV